MLANKLSAAPKTCWHLYLKNPQFFSLKSKKKKIVSQADEWFFAGVKNQEVGAREIVQWLGHLP